MKMPLKFVFLIGIPFLFLQVLSAQNGAKEALVTEQGVGFKNNLKVRPFSPFLGHVGLSYERFYKANRSWEFELGVIGIGKNQASSDRRGSDYYKDQGFYFGGSYKFIFSNNALKELKAAKEGKLLQGWYIRPQLLVSSYAKKMREGNNQPTSILAGAFLLNTGSQWVFMDRLVLDVFVGLGVSADNFEESGFIFHVDYHYAFANGNSQFLAWSTGLKLGFAF